MGEYLTDPTFEWVFLKIFQKGHVFVINPLCSHKWELIVPSFNSLYVRGRQRV